MKILLVEDDAEILEIVKHGLEQAQYRVDTVTNGAEAIAAMRRELYSLIVLDLMLPKVDGLLVCQRLRAQKSTVPILMISARAEISDRIQGLESGADDYLSKPFDFGELLARVRSLLRREMLHKSRRIEIGDLRIDTALRSVVRGERQVLLTRLEYDLLECLASQEGRTVTRDLLLERIWTDNSPISNKIDVAIASLRKKIDRGHPSRLIHTVHGFGYKLAVGSREP